MSGPDTSNRPAHGAWVVVGCVFSLALVLGVVAYWRYTVSEAFIHDSLLRFDQVGAELSPDECVAEVLAWNASCEAMKSLCDHAVPMLMEHCLAARDRASTCTNLSEDVTGRGQWTYERCLEHGVTRANKKVCTGAYRALVQHCRTGQRGVIL
jgi:hypothetical protein